LEDQFETDRQRRVQQTGAKLEINVQTIINEILKKKDIEAFTVAQIRRWAKIGSSYKKLYDYIQVPIKNSCTQQQVMTLPDTDLLVVYKQEDKTNPINVTWHPLCIISCKASFHARETESLFWSALMQNSKIKFVVVTEDANRYGKKHNTELGKCETATKIRRLLECFVDRTYIIKKYEKVNNGILKNIDSFYHVFEKAEAQAYRNVDSKIFDDYERKPHAEYCKNIRPFDDLLIDIMKWKFEKLG
jgi:hypothetical protein